MNEIKENEINLNEIKENEIKKDVIKASPDLDSFSDSSQGENLPALALTEKLRAYADQNNNGVLDSSVIEAVTGMSSSWGDVQPEFIFDEDDAW